MKSLWQKLLADEAGVVLSSEIALVGTVGVLGMVVGLEAVSCAVTSELNDLSSAFGAIDQSYNYRSISKLGHARASGSGFNDNRDVCDCQLITQGDVFGQSGQSGQAAGFDQSVSRQSVVVNSAPVVREEVIEERVIEEEKCVEPATIKALDCPEDEIIEEHIIRRRVRADCGKTLNLKSDCDTTMKVVPKAKVSKSPPAINPEAEVIETKPKSKKKN